MSSLLDQLMGKKAVQEMTSCGSVGTIDSPAPGLAGNRRLRFKMKKSTTLKESGNSIFPEGAEPIDPGEGEKDLAQTPDLEGDSNNPEEPQIPEPLIPVTAALVAPDTTPDWYKPIDPSQVPDADAGVDPEIASRDPVLDVILGRSKAAKGDPSNTTTVESVSLPTGIPSAAEFAGHHGVGGIGLETVVASAMTPGIEQPPPPPKRDISEHLETMRRMGQL